MKHAIVRVYIDSSAFIVMHIPILRKLSSVFLDQYIDIKILKVGSQSFETI